MTKPSRNTVRRSIVPSPFVSSKITIDPTGSLSPMPSGFERLGFASFAEFARDRLLARGVASDRVVALPVPASAQDRTYLSAVIVREWAQRTGLALDALDVFSSGVHSRRSWLLYRLAFGSGVPDGKIRRSPPVVDPVTVTFRTIDSAVVGIPQRPGIVKVRLPLARMAGPPYGPLGFRVSAIRHGVTVENP